MIVYPIDIAPKNGQILELLVDYSEGDGSLQDATKAWTIGFNSLENTGEDVWQFAGWSWCGDCFVQGSGEVIGWRHSSLNEEVE